MASVSNIESKINADATHLELSNSNSIMSKEPRVVNPLFKDQKRVIRKMIVMNTSKLKELGIESTIKNAMSKLEKGNHNQLKTNKSTMAATHQPLHASSQMKKPTITRESQPSILPVDPKVVRIKHIVRPGLVSSKAKIPVPEHVNIRPSIHAVKHVISPTLPRSKSINSDILKSKPVQSVSTHSTAVINNVVQTTIAPTKPTTLNTNRVHQLVIPSKSTITIIKPQQIHSGSTQTISENSILSSSAMASQNIKGSSGNMSMKTEGTLAPASASDGKKIKILSDVSLNDAKAKLLEIDKISSKNLKFTNVIKGTDKNPSKKIVQTPNPASRQLMSLSSTSIPSEVVVKQEFPSINTDSQIEIILPTRPVKQPKTRDRPSNADPSPFPMDDDDNKSFQDHIWATNNPRTYARHNVKRLLNAKIMERTRLQEEPFVKNLVVKTEKEDKTEIPPTDTKTTSKIEGQGHVPSVKYDTKPVTIEIIERFASNCEDQRDNVSERYDIKPAITNVDEPMHNEVNTFESSPIYDHLTPSTSRYLVTEILPSTADVVPAELTNYTPPPTFHGFSVDEANENTSVLARINAFLLKHRLEEAKRAIDTPSVREKMLVESDSDHWIINYETGVLEENVDAEVDLNVPSTIKEELNISGNSSQDRKQVNESPPRKQNSLITKVLEDNLLKAHISSKSTTNSSTSHFKDLNLNSTTSDISTTPSKRPLTEDADDEISDIDLAHCSKAKCFGNTSTPTVKNRRAILKSIELHRKAFNPATTDEESEISLCVRPPRPKLRKSRHRQTVEQLKIQQSAHVSLLKRFNQADSEYDVWNDETIAYFIGSVDVRIGVLENQVECCFVRPSIQLESNVKVNNSSQECLPNVDFVSENIESVKHSEFSVNNQPTSSVVVSEPQILQANVCDIPEKRRDADDCEGQSRIHKVTIQKDTFLVTEYDDKCDKADHQPMISSVKLEKDTSPKPKRSLHRSRVKKNTETTRPNRRKRQSLVQMLAECVDQDTLKSVIIAHEKQKCDFSSSDDSDSEDDDVISKIFRTVCTIDLCDDDDETLHEDVLQYIDDGHGVEDGNGDDVIDTGNGDDRLSNLPTDDISKKNCAQNNNPEPHKISYVKPQKVKIKSEATEISVTIPEEATTANVPTFSNDNTLMKNVNPNSDPTAIVLKESERNTETLDASVVDATVRAPSENSNVSAMGTESHSPTNIDDTEMDIEMNDTTVDMEVGACPPVVDNQDSLATKEPPRNILKLRPFDEISCFVEPQVENDITVNSKKIARKKLSSKKTITQNEPVALEDEPKTKWTSKVGTAKISDAVETNLPENSVDANQNESQIPDISFESKSKAEHTGISRKRNTSKTEQISKDKVKFSSIPVNDDSAVGGIKIKIKIEKDVDGANLDGNSAIPLVNNNPKINGIVKPSRSRKRKADKTLEVIPATAHHEEENNVAPKKPIFDYFDSPEILTTKRVRKSKSYADCDIPSVEVAKSRLRSVSQRTSTRKTYVQSESYTDVDVEQAAEQSSDVTQNASIETENQDLPLKEAERKDNDAVVQFYSTPLKTGRGIKPPVLAPIYVADQYICGNCKEEVLAKNWMKHMKVHYGLGWRVDVDPPIDLDNIHTMGAKIINFMKKTNMRTLKCKKCSVEKKSALGYLSHVEVCGLTTEEIKSKLVKCDYCPSMVRSCSIRTHQTLCSGLKMLVKKEKDLAKEEDIVEESYNEIGRAVRRSAKKAMSSFKDLGKPPEAKLEDYVVCAKKISGKQHRKWRLLLKDKLPIVCVRKECTYTTDDLPVMLNHFNACVLINGETFYCNRCDYGPDTRDIIEEHIKSNHSLGIIESIDDKDFSDSDDEAEIGEESSESEGESGDDETLENDDDQFNDNYDDDDDDGWNTKGYKKKRLRDWGHNEVMLNSCLDRKVLNEHAQLLKSYSSGSYFQPALEWTQDFRDKHFSTQVLYEFATPNSFSVLNSTLTDVYTPKISISNKFLVKEVRKYKKQFGSTDLRKSDEWKTLKRFEATTEEDSIVLFTGGPILSMAWLPVPDDNLSQVLAVCCRSHPDEDILLNNTKQTKCLIQIWNFNKLKNGQLQHAKTPNLLYSIAYDYGPVIQMEFCPSGGFTEDRLGLLAVSSFDGHVDVLALPKNFTCDNSTIEDLVFVIPPSLTLCCALDNPFDVLITKLVWSQSRGHTKLAAGYSNGLVAIWNLKNLQTPHTCTKINGIPTLLPNDLFFAAHKTIKLLEFHHDEKNEARWLVAGSHDRKVRFFDTHNVYLEISTTFAHSRIVAGCWPMHWTTFLFGLDNAYSLKTSGIVVKQPLDIGCRTGTFYSCIGSTCDISFNNWLNSYVFVTSYGDIHVGYLRQMVSGFVEARRQRSILGYTDAVVINELSENAVVDDKVTILDNSQPSTSSAGTCEIAKDILYPSTDGIVFCDFLNPLPAVTSPNYEKIRAPPMDTFNMVKLNKILFNPNVSAYKLYALGYESGFVRINQLLPK